MRRRFVTRRVRSTRTVAAFALFVALVGWVPSAMAQSISDVEARNKAIVQDRFDAWKNGTGSPFELLAEDASWTIVGSSVVAKTYGDRDSFLSEVIRPFNARMREQLRPSTYEVLADGDRVVILFNAHAIARDGEPYTNTYTWFFRLRDGKVVDAIAFFDSIAFNDMWERVDPAL